MLEVAVHDHEVIGLAFRDTLEDAGGEPPVLRVPHDDPDLGVAQGLYKLLRSVLGVVVHEDDLEIGIELPEGLRHVGDVAFFVERGDHYCTGSCHGITINVDAPRRGL